MAAIALKKLSDSSGITIEESNIVIVRAITGGSHIEYIHEISGRRDGVKVANTPAEIAGVSAGLVLIVLVNNSSVATYINMERIIGLSESGGKAVVSYNAGGVNKARYVSTGTKATFQTAIYAKQGYSTYAVASYSGDNIILTPAVGDVTSIFTVGRIITVYGALDVNNDTYIVASSAYASNTIITLATGTGVPDDTDLTGRVMIK